MISTWVIAMQEVLNLIKRNTPLAFTLQLWELSYLPVCCLVKGIPGHYAIIELCIERQYWLLKQWNQCIPYSQHCKHENITISMTFQIQTCKKNFCISSWLLVCPYSQPRWSIQYWYCVKTQEMMIPFHLNPFPHTPDTDVHTYYI